MLFPVKFKCMAAGAVISVQSIFDRTMFVGIPPFGNSVGLIRISSSTFLSQNTSKKCLFFWRKSKLMIAKFKLPNRKANISRYNRPHGQAKKLLRLSQLWRNTAQMDGKVSGLQFLGQLGTDDPSCGRSASAACFIGRGLGKFPWTFCRSG